MEFGIELISWLLTSGLFVIVLYLLFDQHNSIWEKKKVPCVKKGFLFGNVFPVFTTKLSMGQLFEKLYWKGGNSPYFGFYVTNKPALLIKDPAILRQVMVKDFNYFMHRNFHIDEKVDFSGNGNIFVNCTERWKHIRTKLTPVFTTSKLKYMFSLMVEVAQDMTKKISSEKGNKDELDVHELNCQYTTDIISSVVLGFKSNSLTDPDSEYRKFGKLPFETSYKRVFELITHFLTPSIANLLRIPIFPTPVTQLLKGTFDEMVRYRKEEKLQRNDLIDLLVQLQEGNTNDSQSNNNNSLTYNEIIGTVTTFFSAGFETTASTMTYTLYELAFDQEYQELVRSEIKEALAANNDKLTYEIVQSLKYLDWGISEALRKYPLLPFLDRKCMADYRVPTTDLVIPADTMIYISLSGMQNDSKYFPNPEKFDPYRFSDERKDEIVPFTYMPFGEGPRNCIGMRFGVINAKNGLLHILKSYKVVPHEDTPKKLSFSSRALLLASTDIIKLRFIRLD